MAVLQYRRWVKEEEAAEGRLNGQTFHVEGVVFELVDEGSELARGGMPRASLFCVWLRRVSRRRRSRAATFPPAGSYFFTSSD